MPSSSHGLSLLVETRKTVLTEMKDNVMFMYRCFHMLLTIMCSITLQRMHVSEMGL